jgi:hypothetical protein
MALKSIKRLILSIDGACTKLVQLFSDAILNEKKAFLFKVLMQSLFS